MTDYVWPNGVRMSSVTWRHISNSVSTPETFTGGMQTSAKPGDRLGCVVRVQNATGAEITKLRAFVAMLRGRANRCFLYDKGFKISGSFPASELLTNSEFYSGTTGWTASPGAITASNGVLRLISTDASAPQLSQSVALTQYAPHVMRAVCVMGTSMRSVAQQLTVSSTVAIGSTLGQIRGYLTLAAVGLDGSSQVQYPVFNYETSGYLAGDYMLVPFVSLSRCALVDGGGNILLRSDETDNAAWTRSGLASISANSGTSPDGTSTAEVLVENSSNTAHFISQSVTVSSAAADYMFACAVHQSNRSWCALTIQENSGSTSVVQYFNSADGSIGVSSAGANWLYLRSFASDMGGGWWLFALIGRKTNAATSLTCFINSASANGTGTYLGTGVSSIVVWRATLNQTSVPSRLTASLGTAVSASTQMGPLFYVKGLPASTMSLLKAGDQVEIDKQIKFAVADLNSDSAGYGVLILDSPLARSVSDNAPIIIQKPMAKFVLMNDAEYEIRPGLISDFEFTFEQDLSS